MTECVPPFQYVTITLISRTMNDVIFLRTPVDNKIGPFVTFMDAEFHKYTDGYWSASLLFKELKLGMP